MVAALLLVASLLQVGGGTPAGADRALSNLSNAATARTNLGLSTAAVEDVGTDVGDVCQLVDVGGGVAGLPAVSGANLSGVTDSGALAKASNLSDLADPAAAAVSLSLEPGVDVQAYDATTAALASLAWTAGTQVPSFTGADQAGLLDVGGDDGLVRLTAGAYPAGDGSALTNLPGSGTFDWAASHTSLAAASWTDATAWGGTDALTFADAEGGTTIRLTAAQGATNVGQGMFQTIGAGDFIVGARLALVFSGANLVSSASYCKFALAFVDGADLGVAGSDWFGVGFKHENESLDFGDFAAYTGTDFNTETLSNNVNAYTDVVDVFLRRSGTSLIAYVARGGGLPRQITTWTVSGGAGLIGFRINTIDSAPKLWRGHVLAYGSLAHVPGHE